MVKAVYLVGSNHRSGQFTLIRGRYWVASVKPQSRRS